MRFNTNLSKTVAAVALLLAGSGVVLAQGDAGTQRRVRGTGTRGAATTRTQEVDAAAASVIAKFVPTVADKDGGTNLDKCNSTFRPKLFATLPNDLHNPDGMTVSDKTGTIFLAVPNFNGRPENKGPKLNPGFLVRVNPADGSFEKVLEFPVLESTGQCGPMGLAFGPDGHLYVCDNQYFFDADHKSRILRVKMDGDKPTGEIEVVIVGLKLPNAILWNRGRLFFTDTFLDLPNKFGSGGLWMFTESEVLRAGSGGNPPIKVQPNGTDPRLVAIVDVTKVGRGDNGGLDGLTVANGMLYSGNFGDGAIYAIRPPRQEGEKATVETIHAAGEVITCVDGVFYDRRTNKVYINDSQRNAIHAFTPTRRGEKAVLTTVWENADTSGADGLLDQPCECVVIGSKMIIANFDWTFPGLRNSKFDEPHTLSVIDLE